MSGKSGKKRDRREGERIGEDIMRDEKGAFARRWAGGEKRVARRVGHRRSVGLLKRVEEDMMRGGRGRGMVGRRRVGDTRAVAGRKECQRSVSPVKIEVKVEGMEEEVGPHEFGGRVDGS